MLTVAGVLLVLYLGVELLGWRQHTTFLSLTPSDTVSHSGDNAFAGTVYIALYIGTTVAAPILVIATGIELLLSRLVSGGSSKRTS